MRISKTKQKQMKALRVKVADEEAEQEREEYKARSYPDDETQYFSISSLMKKGENGMRKAEQSPLLEAVKEIQKLEIMKEGYQRACELQAAVFADAHNRRWGKTGLSYKERNRLKAAERKAAAAEKRRMLQNKKNITRVLDEKS